MSIAAEPPGGYRLMGILNVTPDSFSDGGRFLDARAAVAHARALLEQGAHILDIGGESTRPGAQPVSAEQELARVLPVLEALAADGVRAQISIDTCKSHVARAALRTGASLVNDVSAFRSDPHMAGLVADSRAYCCLMHMQGEPRTMQRQPRYRDVVDDVAAFLEERLAFAVREGVSEERVLLDPGIGFGKTVQHNLQLLLRLGEIASLGRPVVIGTSRKSFLGRIAEDSASRESSSCGVPSASARLAGTLASNVLAYERGASVFRVHDVAPVREALAVAAATLHGRWTGRSTTRTQTTS